MFRAYHILILSLLACLSLSCSGETDENTDLVLTADQTVLSIGDESQVVFTVLLGSSDVSSSESMHIRYMLGDETFEMEPGNNVFVPETAGAYTFTAVYTDEDMEIISNSVEVTVTEAPVIRDYLPQILAMQFTSVGCQNCPFMSDGLKTVSGENPGQINIVSFHQYFDNVADPMECDETSLFASKFGVKGLPQCYMNLRPEKVTAQLADLREAVDTELARGAVCGVAIESAIAEGNISVTVKVSSNESAVYRYLIFLVENGIEYMQYGVEEPEYIHNNVVRKVLSMSSNGERLNGGSPLVAGVEYSATRSASLDDSWNTENMYVVAAALTSEDGGISYICANSAKCLAGESSEYVLNE